MLPSAIHSQTVSGDTPVLASSDLRDVLYLDFSSRPLFNPLRGFTGYAESGYYYSGGAITSTQASWGATPLPARCLAILNTAELVILDAATGEAWMRFDLSASLFAGENPTRLSLAPDGILVCGDHLTWISWGDDTLYRFTTSGLYRFTDGVPLTLAQRNTTSVTAGFTTEVSTNLRLPATATVCRTAISPPELPEGTFIVAGTDHGLAVLHMTEDLTYFSSLSDIATQNVVQLHEAGGILYWVSHGAAHYACRSQTEWKTPDFAATTTRLLPVLSAASELYGDTLLIGTGIGVFASDFSQASLLYLYSIRRVEGGELDTLPAGLTGARCQIIPGTAAAIQSLAYDAETGLLCLLLSGGRIVELLLSAALTQAVPVTSRKYPATQSTTLRKVIVIPNALYTRELEGTPKILAATTFDDAGFGGAWGASDGVVITLTFSYAQPLFRVTVVRVVGGVIVESFLRATVDQSYYRCEGRAYFIEQVFLPALDPVATHLKIECLDRGASLDSFLMEV